MVIIVHPLKIYIYRLIRLCDRITPLIIKYAGVTLPHVIVHCIVRFSRFCKRIVMGLNRPMIYAA